MISLRTQIYEALTHLSVIAVAFPPVFAIGFWLRFDAPVWSAFL